MKESVKTGERAREMEMVEEKSVEVRWKEFYQRDICIQIAMEKKVNRCCRLNATSL